jgi:hypothetical protein
LSGRYGAGTSHFPNSGISPMRVLREKKQSSKVTGFSGLFVDIPYVR